VSDLSTAVMARRRDPASALDLYPTPPWATRALVEEVLVPEGLVSGGHAGTSSAYDPCCGQGHMAIPLAEYFASVRASDVHDWGYGERRDLDFTMASAEVIGRPDWVIANPPFALADRFVDRALTIARDGVSMLLRLQWLEGGERYQTIFSGTRKPALVCPFAERVPMIEGCWDPEASSATAYAWFVWDCRASAPARSSILHIRPGMAQLYHRPQDEALAVRGEARRRAAARKAA